MAEQGKMAKWLERARERVRESEQRALCDQLERTLELSVNLHEQLEGGYHTHHTEESDSHGWAVADGATLIRSGASHLSDPNVYGSARRDAEEEAVKNAGRLTGVFSAVMAHPFEGGNEHDKGGIPTSVGESGEPHDSIRFEMKIQGLLKVSAHQWLPTYLRKNRPSAIR